MRIVQSASIVHSAHGTRDLPKEALHDFDHSRQRMKTKIGRRLARRVLGCTVAFRCRSDVGNRACMDCQGIRSNGEGAACSRVCTFHNT